MAATSHPLIQDQQCDRVSKLQAPSGYTSWREWLAGKALPLAIFTLFLLTNSLTFPGDVMQSVREEISPYLLLELIRRTLVLGFLVLVVAAYLTRTHAVARASGFWERVFPLLVLVATSLGVSLIGRTTVPQHIELAGAGILLALLGYGVSLWALWHLRGSFAIMVEARSPVMIGPYRYVRHPLYLGEALTMLGLCLMSGTVITFLFWGIISGMQLMRAWIEERKLARQFDDYRAYQQRTRFILPGLC